MEYGSLESLSAKQGALKRDGEPERLPYRCSRGWRWGCGEARVLNGSTVLPPWAGARGFNVTGLNYLAHPILKLEDWSLRSGNEPFHCASIDKSPRISPLRQVPGAHTQGPSVVG